MPHNSKLDCCSLAFKTYGVDTGEPVNSVDANSVGTFVRGRKSRPKIILRDLA